MFSCEFPIFKSIFEKFEFSPETNPFLGNVNYGAQDGIGLEIHFGRHNLQRQSRTCY